MDAMVIGFGVGVAVGTNVLVDAGDGATAFVGTVGTSVGKIGDLVAAPGVCPQAVTKKMRQINIKFEFRMISSLYCSVWIRKKYYMCNLLVE